MSKHPIRIRPLQDPVVKLKKTHPDAVLPVANNQEHGTGDTGFDLVAVESVDIMKGSSEVVPVGLTLADIDPGYWIRIEPRSGLGFKHSIQPHLGVIDNGYRGDLAVKLYNFNQYNSYRVSKGDKIAQLAIYPLIQPTFEFVDTVTNTSRGSKGFGSSDSLKHADSPPPPSGYISNPMKVDEGDPDWIPDSEYFTPEDGGDISGCGHDHT